MMTSGPAPMSPTSSDWMDTTSAWTAPAIPRTVASSVFGSAMPSRASAAGATSVRSAPVSRTSVTKLPPLIRALTRMGAPGVNGILVPDPDTAAGSAAGGSTPETGMLRAVARYCSGTLSIPVV
jgi:hypothetical protein